MLALPPDPVPGQPIRAQDIAAIYRYLRAITPRTSSSCRVTAGSGGSTQHPIFPRQRPQTPAVASVTAYAFKMYDASVNTSGTNTAQIRVNSGDGFAGAVNGNIANIGGTLINYTPPAAPAPNAPPVLPVSDGDYVYIHLTNLVQGQLTSGSAAPNSVTLLAAASVPANDTASPPTFQNYPIGTVAVQTDPTTGKVTVIPANSVTGSLLYFLCGSTPVWEQ